MVYWSFSFRNSTLALTLKGHPCNKTKNTFPTPFLHSDFSSTGANHLWPMIIRQKGVGFQKQRWEIHNIIYQIALCCWLLLDPAFEPPRVHCRSMHDSTNTHKHSPPATRHRPFLLQIKRPQRSVMRNPDMRPMAESQFMQNSKAKEVSASEFY
jgi:hypothetical protein